MAGKKGTVPPQFQKNVKGKAPVPPAGKGKGKAPGMGKKGC